MEYLKLEQGTEEWKRVRLEHFTASEAPAMMGDSKYSTRDELLTLKKTGEEPEITPSTQFIFDRGHQAEADIRPIVEKIVGEDLFPVTGKGEGDLDKLLASFDGLTFLSDLVFEHKLYSTSLARAIEEEEDLPPHYYWQLEQQIMLSGAEKALFVCSDGTEERFASMYYYPVPGRAEKLLAGWEQFALDLAEFVPLEKTEKLVADPIKDLPSITYKLDGLSLTSNIDVFKKAADAMVERAKLPIETEQDLANCDKLNKIIKATEDKIKFVKEQIIGEIVDVDTFNKDLDYIAAQIRTVRLAGEKKVTKHKETQKKELLKIAADAIAEHMKQTNGLLKESILIATPAPNYTGAIKGKKGPDSIRSSLNDLVAATKLEINAVFMDYTEKLAQYEAHASSHKFLFRDLQELIDIPLAGFVSSIKERVSAYEEEQTSLESRQNTHTSTEPAAGITAESSPPKQLEIPPSQTAHDILSDDRPPRRCASEPILDRDYSAIAGFTVSDYEKGIIDGIYFIFNVMHPDAYPENSPRKIKEAIDAYFSLK